jgi:hypothetical protein
VRPSHGGRTRYAFSGEGKRILKPVAYMCFFILQNKKSYLGEEVNRGFKGTIWNALLIAAILVVAAGAFVKIISLF